MNMRKIAVVLSALVAGYTAPAQDAKPVIRGHIEKLASPEFHGRGYVNNGGDIAANYIADVFKKNGLLPVKGYGSYFQDYTFPINTFPARVNVTINKTELTPGTDFIVNAASSSWMTDKRYRMKVVKLGNVKDSAAWAQTKKKFKPGKAYLLTQADTPINKLGLGIRKFATELPEGLFVVPKHGKLIWTANTNQVPGTIVYVEDTVMPARPKRVKTEIEAKFVKEFHAKNVVGYVKGTEVPDSFIVFTAHFDHLGRMGKKALFAGASDNGTGTSQVLYLAEYFAKHPQRYSVAFMLFSGEEAGLLGSKYYVENPLFPLKQIRFLVNLDMTGDATNGITVVNGVAHEPEFAILDGLNVDSMYAKKINKRERTSNSDHYFFSKEGVPAFFIFTNGTKPFYHDVLDLPKEIPLERVDDFSKLLIKFTAQLTGTVN